MAGPVPGTNIPITLPANKVIYWSAIAQAAYLQHIEIKAPTGKVVASAQGNGQPLRRFGEGSFNSGGGGVFHISIWVNTPHGPRPESVIFDEHKVVFGGQTKYGQFTFLGEDGADQDFNDTTLELHWWDRVG